MQGVQSQGVSLIQTGVPQHQAGDANSGSRMKVTDMS